jgi:hypothetical protein
LYSTKSNEREDGDLRELIVILFVLQWKNYLLLDLVFCCSCEALCRFAVQVSVLIFVLALLVFQRSGHHVSGSSAIVCCLLLNRIFSWSAAEFPSGFIFAAVSGRLELIPSWFPSPGLGAQSHFPVRSLIAVAAHERSVQDVADFVSAVPGHRFLLGFVSVLLFDVVPFPAQDFLSGARVSIFFADQFFAFQLVFGS